jgi:hypothetical protein
VGLAFGLTPVAPSSRGIREAFDPPTFDRERMKSWPMPLVLSRLGFVALLLVLGVEIVRHSLGDVLSNDNPALSIIVDPTESGARLSVADTLLAGNPPKIDEAVASVRQALGTNPLFPGALTVLALASEQAGDEDRTRRLMTLAGRVELRDTRAHLWLLNQDLRDVRVGSAMEQIDIMMRGQELNVIARLVEALASIVTHEPFRSGYVELLRTNPPWRPAWFHGLIGDSRDFSGLAYLFDELQANKPGPTEEELQAVLTRLVEAGMFDEAHDIWIRSVPLDRREEADLLYNKGFRFQITNLPFDWVIAPVPNATVGFDSPAGAQVMNVDFFGGRVQFQHVSHLLNLAPGSYRFQGQERAQALQNERGLQWRIACVDGEGEDLATTDPLNGDTPWRPFAVEFTVPTGKCFYQVLVLELRARAALESEVVGRVSYADLDLQPNSGSQGVSLKIHE